MIAPIPSVIIGLMPLRQDRASPRAIYSVVRTVAIRVRGWPGDTKPPARSSG